MKVISTAESALLPQPVKEKEVAFPEDIFTGTLKICVPPAVEEEEERAGQRAFSLKLDLRAIQEVERMEGFASEEDFAELLSFPKVQDFMAKSQHDEEEIQAFWLKVRIRYFALLQPKQRARGMRSNDQRRAKPALVMAAFFNLSAVQERLCLVSRMTYREFAALIKETDKLGLSLKASKGDFVNTIAYDKQNSEIRRSARRTFLAR